MINDSARGIKHHLFAYSSISVMHRWIAKSNSTPFSPLRPLYPLVGVWLVESLRYSHRKACFASHHSSRFCKLRSSYMPMESYHLASPLFSYHLHMHVRSWLPIHVCHEVTWQSMSCSVTFRSYTPRIAVLLDARDTCQDRWVFLQSSIGAQIGWRRCQVPSQSALSLVKPFWTARAVS